MSVSIDIGGAPTDEPPQKHFLCRHPDGTIDLAELVNDLDIQAPPGCEILTPGLYFEDLTIVSPADLQAALGRIASLGSMLLAVDRVRITRAGESFHDKFLMPARRARKRTLSLIVLDALYFVAQRIVTASLSADIVTALQDANTVSAIVLCVCIAVIGVMGIMKGSRAALSLFVFLGAASATFLVRSNTFAWLFVVIRSLMLLSASHLLFLWIRASRAAAHLQNSLADFAVHHTSLFEQIDSVSQQMRTIESSAPPTQGDAASQQYMQRLAVALMQVEAAIATEMTATWALPESHDHNRGRRGGNRVSPRETSAYVRELRLGPRRHRGLRAVAAATSASPRSPRVMPSPAT